VRARLAGGSLAGTAHGSRPDLAVEQSVDMLTADRLLIVDSEQGAGQVDQWSTDSTPCCSKRDVARAK
jgi:hypothetical protein